MSLASDLSALRAPRPIPPKLEAAVGDRKVHIILRDLEKIKNSKPSKKLKRCEHLIYFIVHSLRKAKEDHLLHSTSIWVLVTIFRIFPDETKPIMMDAGVPGLLLDIMKLGVLSGSSRQYASELCFYLSTNHPYPQEEGFSGPMKSFPEIQPVNRYQEAVDDISVGSDLSSMVNEGRGKDRYPFVPYRINDINLAKMEALFEKGYEHELAASLPNSNILSRYGFSDYDPKMLSGQNDDSSDSDVNYDDDDVSTLSSGTRSASVASYSSASHAGTASASWAVSRATSKVDLSASLARSHLHRHPSRTAPTSNKRARGLGLLKTESEAELKTKVAKQFNIHAPRRPDDLLQLFDDNDSLALSQSSGQRSYTSHRSERHSTAPHRVVHHLRQHNVSASPQRVKTTGGIFMADAIVSEDNWSSMRKVEGRSQRPLPPKFMMGTVESTNNAGPTDLQTYLSTLDPLSLALPAPDEKENSKRIAQQVFTEEMHWEDLMDDQSDQDSVEGGDMDNGDDFSANERVVEDEFMETPLQRSKKMRMKAEKLIDHSFINKFFVHKKPDIPMIQDLLRRIEQLFELLDRDHTGYVTFEAFTRLLIAVAPQHILRKDIEAFVSAQTSNTQDLVDYHEFIISGKVLLLTKAQALQAKASKSKVMAAAAGQKAPLLPELEDKQVSSTKSWLTRQKAITGDSSTYTWKNHVEWYQKRKAQALIWLIRRATRALDHEVVLLDAKKWLLVKAKQSLAWSYLIEMGRISLLQKDRANVARQKLLKRVMHARYFILKVQRTHEHLKSIAAAKLRELEYLDRIQVFKESQRVQEVKEIEALHFRSKQADYASLFKVHALQKRAKDYLMSLAKKAIVHSAKQQENLAYLISYATKVQGQLIIKDRARRELIQRAEAAYQFLIKQDQVLLGLLRIGQRALAFFDRQTDALNFLLAKGPAAIAFLSTQHQASVDLYTIGRQTLSFMNTREDAYSYLCRRKEKSILFIEKKREAMQFLQKKPHRVWKVLDACNDAQDWLVKRAIRAKQHLALRQKAQQYLAFIASRANATSRRIVVAYQELCQIGLLARFDSFKLWAKSTPRVQKLIATEYKHVRKVDQLTGRQRKGMNMMIRNKIELREAFEILCTIATPKQILNSKNEIQRLEDLISDQSITTLLAKTMGTGPLPPSSPSKANKSISQAAVNTSTLSTFPMSGTMTSTFRSELQPNLASAFQAANPSDTPTSYLMGRIGLRRLFSDGKLLNVDGTAVDEFFKNVDIRQHGYISFNELLPWWRDSPSMDMLDAHHRSILHVERVIALPEILHPLERAYINVYKRVMRELKEEEEEENEFTKFRNRKREMSESEDSDSDMSSNDDSDEMNSEEEESLMSDVNKLQNVDVGKLMRYLTRRRRAIDMSQHQQPGQTNQTGVDGGASADLSTIGDDASTVVTAENPPNQTEAPTDQQLPADIALTKEDNAASPTEVVKA